MIHKKKIKNNIKFDIAVVGAGPTGVAFACGFVGTNIKVQLLINYQEMLLLIQK